MHLKSTYSGFLFAKTQKNTCPREWRWRRRSQKFEFEPPHSWSAVLPSTLSHASVQAASHLQNRCDLSGHVSPAVHQPLYPPRFTSVRATTLGLIFTTSEIQRICNNWSSVREKKSTLRIWRETRRAQIFNNLYSPKCKCVNSTCITLVKLLLLLQYKLNFLLKIQH